MTTSSLTNLQGTAMSDVKREGGRESRDKLHTQNAKYCFVAKLTKCSQTELLAARTMIFTQKMIALSYFPNILNQS